MIKFSESGEILIIVFVSLGVVLFTVLSVVAGAQVYFQNASYSVDGEKAAALAEAGIDKAINSLNKTGGSYSGEGETSLGDGSYSVTITSKDVATKFIESTGYIPSKAKARAKRTIKIASSRGVGASFVYGIQVGEGGLVLGNTNLVTGTIYSNGSISAGNGNTITGDVWIAGGPQAFADQQTDCIDNNCSDFIFGKDVNGQLDVAQSFQATSSAMLNKISIKVRKFGNPADAIVRIMKDDGGKPDKNQVLATGTLLNTLVTGTYSFIDVTFDKLADLTANTTYWMMVDTSANSNNYWYWQKDLAQSYTRGEPKWSADWKAGNPTWTAFNHDLSFKIYMGGAPTFLDGGQNLNIGGSVHANTIKNATIQKDAYYQVISNSTAAKLFPNWPDPPPKVFPLSDANIEEFKINAENSGPITFTECTPGLVLGPGKITGDVTFNSNCVITIKSPIWITGNLTFNTNNRLTLDSSYGSVSGVIVVTGKVTLGSNNILSGSGVDSSILMVASEYDSRVDNVSAILVTNTGNSGVFYANKGIIEPGNKNTFKELTAWGIKLVNNSTIDYETGLSSSLFTSGPSGSYSLVKGTYQLK